MPKLIEYGVFGPMMTSLRTGAVMELPSRIEPSLRPRRRGESSVSPVRVLRESGERSQMMAQAPASARAPRAGLTRGPMRSGFTKTMPSFLVLR